MFSQHATFAKRLTVAIKIYWFDRIIITRLVRGNRGLLNGPASSYVKSLTGKSHTRPYMVTKRTHVWNKTFPLGHFMLHFRAFHNVSIYV